MQWAELTCAGCGTVFRKPTGEITRQRKRGRTEFFCGMRCYARMRGASNLGAYLGVGRVDHLRADNRKDEYSPFRYFLRKARARDPRTDLDLEHLAALWAAQRGRCALSGRRMELPRNGQEWERRTHDPWKPSLDRVEGTRGYTRGNVRFVTVIANLSKSGFSDADVIEFCRDVVTLADRETSTQADSAHASRAFFARLTACRHREVHHVARARVGGGEDA